MNRPPLLLVHGYLSIASTLLPVRRGLRARGFDARLVSLDPLLLGDIGHLGRQLGRNVERVRRQTGADRVDVVGMSLGGLIGLWWLHHGGGREACRRFVGVGTPFQGTWAAAAGVAALGLVSRGAWQMLPGSRLIQQITSSPPPVPSWSISMEGDQLAPPARCWLDGAEQLVIDGCPARVLAHHWLILHPSTCTHIARVLS